MKTIFKKPKEDNMKKLVLILALALAFPFPAFAGNGAVHPVSTSVAVASTATVTTGIIPIKYEGYFGIWYQATSVTGTPDIKIEYEMSYNDTSANFAEPVGASDIVTNLTAETIQIESIQPPPMPFIRFKITGNAGNPADTLVTIRLFSQEP